MEIKGYRQLSQTEIDAINKFKDAEREILTLINAVKAESQGLDLRWTSIGLTHIEQGFMALNRAIARPNVLE